MTGSLYLHVEIAIAHHLCDEKKTTHEKVSKERKKIENWPKPLCLNIKEKVVELIENMRKCEIFLA